MKVGVVQMSMGTGRKENIAKAIEFAQETIRAEADIVLLPELFSTPYFCSRQEPKHFSLASSVQNSPEVMAFLEHSRKERKVFVVSFFEQADVHYYNSVAIIEAGKVLGTYRQSHIPDGPGYQEKYYFRPGNTGFRVWDTSVGRVGVGICWDQWFPEAARAMVLEGADILLYPTAIGSEPQEPDLDTSKRWQRVMQGHAASNLVPVCAANRVGQEPDVAFYGHSFATDEAGEIRKSLEEQEGTFVATFNVQELRRERASWGFFRDRRIDLYETLTR